MKSSKNWEKVVGRVYDNLEAALWAALLAFLIYFTFFMIPKMPEVRAQNERARVQEIAAENALYCEKFGMKAGTEKHKQCLLILGNFERRLRNEFMIRACFSNSRSRHSVHAC